MAALETLGDEVPAWWAQRNNDQAAKLVKMLDASKTIETMRMPSMPHVGGGDHPVPQGQFVTFLFQPFVWPVDSETQLATDSQTLSDEAKFFEDKAMEARGYALRVFDGGLWVGEGADAARNAHMQAVSIKFGQSEVSRVASGLFHRASADVAMTKRKMYQENKAAHTEIEAFLRSGSGHSIAQVAVILSTHRATIQDYSTELLGFSTQYTTQFTSHFPESGGDGGGGPKTEHAGNGTRSDTWSDGENPGASSGSGTSPSPGPGGVNASPGPGGVNASPSPTGVKSDSWSDGVGKAPVPGGTLSPSWSDTPTAPPLPTHSPLSTLLGSGGGLPSLPSLGSGVGGGGLPFGGGLQGLMGGFGGFPGGGLMSPAAGLGAGFQAPPPLPSLGMNFGQGLAAGAAAAGAIPSVPQAQMLSLAAPMETAPAVSAAPVAALSAPAAAAAGLPAAGAAGIDGGMTSYGSVLPPAAASAAGGAGGVGLGAAALPAEGGGGSAPAPPGTGLMPVSSRRASAPVPRDLAESDLELAKMAVAELAGAATVTDPGLDWAVAVGRNTSGMPTFWVATNDGATYIPPGVFLRKTMPVAAGFSEDFDARWMGWVNPAEKAVRAAREFGDTVGAVATTWAWPSEYLGEHPAVLEVATGVVPSTTENAAAELLVSRAHRLQTVDAALYADLKAAGDDVLRAYCRELTRQLAFGVAGDELSPVAQSVARALVAQRSPKVEEWAALAAEYEIAQALMGAQRPGLNGVENLDQVVSYCREFIRCRRMEALLCWEQFDADLMNVVYAAWVAGIRAPLKDLALL